MFFWSANKNLGLTSYQYYSLTLPDILRGSKQVIINFYGSLAVFGGVWRCLSVFYVSISAACGFTIYADAAIAVLSWGGAKSFEIKHPKLLVLLLKDLSKQLELLRPVYSGDLVTSPPLGISIIGAPNLRLTNLEIDFF